MASTFAFQLVSVDGVLVAPFLTAFVHLGHVRGALRQLLWFIGQPFGPGSCLLVTLE
jgi:hypothetical protein